MPIVPLLGETVQNCIKLRNTGALMKIFSIHLMKSSILNVMEICII